MMNETTRFESNDVEVASSASPASFKPTGRPHLSYRYATALSVLVVSIAAASAVLYYGNRSSSLSSTSAQDQPPAPFVPKKSGASLRDPLGDDVEHLIGERRSDRDPYANPSHFVEDPPADTSSFHNPLPHHAAKVDEWSPFPVTSPEEHTLGYPFVAACTSVDDETRPLAMRIAGEFDILDAFPNQEQEREEDVEEEEVRHGLFDDVRKEEMTTTASTAQQPTTTWTYTFLLHDAEDLAYFLSFGLDYVPDLVETRDLQDSRIGISHERDEREAAQNPGRRRLGRSSRRLARPQCNDGTCRKACSDCGSGSQECTTCLGGGGGGGGGGGDPECALLTPIDYNSKFTPGLLGNYSSINSYACYRTVLGTNQTVDDIVAAYPDLAEKRILDGYPTVENDFMLYVLVLTNQNFDSATVSPSYGEKGRVLATSSIHSREFAPAETMTRFAEYLLQNYDRDPDIRWMLDWNEIHLVLHANPDGRKYDEVAKDLWRKNRNVAGGCSSSTSYGIDLNRNFPFKHNGCEENGCSSGTCSSNTYRGPSEGSEQETKAIVAYAKTLFPVSQRWGTGSLADAEAQADLNTARPEDATGVFMDVHSYGNYVGYAWGYKNVRSGNDDGLGALGRKLASYNEYRLWAPEMPANQYPVDGDTLDTMYGWLGAAGLFWELGTSFYQSCASFPGIIDEAFPGLLYAVKVAKSPFVTSKGPDVMCLSLSAPGAPSLSAITANVDVSDDARARHADDGSNVLFATGSQTIQQVELYIDCHPNEEGCTPDVTSTFVTQETSQSAAIEFLTPADEGEHVLYVRGVDSDGYAGPVTARTFVTCPSTGCPFSGAPTGAPTPTPPPVSGPTCDSGCTGCGSKQACNTQSLCKWKGQCTPR